MKNEKTISVQIKTKDMFHFLLRHTYTSFSGLFGVFLSCGALVLFAMTYKDNDQMKNIVLLLIGAVFLIVNPIQLWLKAATQIKVSPMFQKPLYYRIDHEGILVSQDEQELPIMWEEIVKVVETRSYIIIYLSTVRAYIWPKEQIKDSIEEIKADIKEKVHLKKCKWRKS